MGSADEMQDCLFRHRTSLKGADSLWQVEKGLIDALSGTQAEIRVKRLVLGCFPTADKAITPTQTIQELKKLIAADGFCFLPTNLQSIVRFSVTMVDAIEQQSLAKLKLDNLTTITSDCWMRCKFFLRFRGSVDSKAPEMLHHSGNAVRALMHAVDAKSKDAQDEETKKHIAMLSKFDFCAPDDVKSCLDKLIAKTKTKKPARKAPPKGAAASSSKKAEDDAATTSAMSYF